VWGLGDYDPVAGRLEPAAHALADACAISAGQQVLDVAAGTGNLALVAASLGATVTASDLSPAMVERGRARSVEQGFDIDWREANAEELPFADASFECAASVFGAVFAPRFDLVAAELFRVVRPGGWVGLTAWTPESFATRLFARQREYMPAPADAPKPHEWGEEALARERLDPHAAAVSFETRSLEMKAPSVDALAEIFEHAPAGVAARETLEPGIWDELGRASREAIAGANEATDDSASVSFEYALIVAQRRG